MKRPLWPRMDLPVLAVVVIVAGSAPSARLRAGNGEESDDHAPPTLATVTPPPPIDADEPRLRSLSPRLAALSLDRAALSWQKERGCGTCHTNFAWLVARPALASVVPAGDEVRAFFESMVLERWETKGPRGDWEIVCAAVTLAVNDARTTGTLHRATRAALDRMVAAQREDGGWDWLMCGWPPMESDEHYGVTFAAIGLGGAPGGYAESEAGRKALGGIRRWLREHPAPSLHHRAMLVWASIDVEGILTADARARIVDELLAAQLPDGGWAVAGLLAGWKEHRRKDERPQITDVSDGYGTGFATWVLRLAGTPADDPRLRRARRWLETNQRASGRWFTPSPTKDSEHFISNAGTAFAALALEACGALRAPAAAPNPGR